MNSTLLCDVSTRSRVIGVVVAAVIASQLVTMRYAFSFNPYDVRSVTQFRRGIGDCAVQGRPRGHPQDVSCPIWGYWKIVQWNDLVQNFYMQSVECSVLEPPTWYTCYACGHGNLLKGYAYNRLPR